MVDTVSCHRNHLSTGGGLAALAGTSVCTSTISTGAGVVQADSRVKTTAANSVLSISEPGIAGENKLESIYLAPG